MNKGELKKIIDKIVDKNALTPDVVLAVVSCDVSKTSFDYFMSYAYEKGIKNAIYGPNP